MFSDLQPRELVDKTQSPKAPTSKLASELAQLYSIANSKVALTGALVLGGFLAVNQVQAANAVDWEVTGSNTFDGGLDDQNVTKITWYWWKSHDPILVYNSWYLHYLFKLNCNFK